MPSLMQEVSASIIGPPIRKNRLSVPSFFNERARFPEPVSSAMMSSRYSSFRARRRREPGTYNLEASYLIIRVRGFPTVATRLPEPRTRSKSQRAAFAQLANLIGAHAEPFLQHLLVVLADQSRRRAANPRALQPPRPPLPIIR